MGDILRAFLLEADPLRPLPDLWATPVDDTALGEPLDASDQTPEGQQGGEGGPTAGLEPPPVEPVPEGPRASLTLGDMLRHHSYMLQDDGAVRLLLFALLQQLLTGQRSGCQADCVAVTPQLWPLPLAAQLPPLSGEGSGVCALDLASLTARWASGQLSNFDYLLALNRLAGRRLGDPNCSSIMPWVLDMTADPQSIPADEAGAPGWRDLTRSKWWLAKGDEQLDLTYATSPVPHHLPGDMLSDVAYCIYKEKQRRIIAEVQARQLPEELLTRVVRGKFNTLEYPASLQRLYEVTPEEAIPELYADPAILVSRHPGMPDLALPAWASTPEDFIAKHRAALESDHVSAQLHSWIDLAFGYKLSGAAAVEAKNVQLPASQLSPASAGGHLGTAGYVQLFHAPHPRRRLPRRHAGTGAAAEQEAPPHDLVACLRLLEELEQDAGTAACSLPGSSGGIINGGGGAAGGQACDGQHGRPPALVQLGQLVVQLYLQRPVHVCPLDTSTWASLLPQLPPAARQLAGTCLAGRMSLADVATLDFFTPAVRVAHAFLAPLYHQQQQQQQEQQQQGTAVESSECLGHPEALAGKAETGAVPSRGSQNGSPQSPALCGAPASSGQAHVQLGQLAQSVAERGLLELAAVPGAQQLCLPPLLAALGAVLERPEAVQGLQGPSGDASPPLDSQHVAAGVLLSLLGTLPGALCSQQVLPAIASWLSGGAGLPLQSKLALLSPQLVRSMVAGGGVAAYIESVQPLLLRQLLAAGGGPRAALHGVVVAALGSVARQVAAPVTFELTLRPLLRALPTCPAAAPALVEVGAALPPHVAVNYVLLQLLRIFDPAQGWDPGHLVPSVVLNVLSALEGLVPLLPAPLMLRHLIAPAQHPPLAGSPQQDDVSPSPLLAALLLPQRQGVWALLPGTAHAVLTRVAALVMQVCSRSGPEATVQQLVPQLVPLFICPDSHRLSYGMHAPGSSAPTQPPPAAQPHHAAAAAPAAAPQQLGRAEGADGSQAAGVLGGWEDVGAGGASGSDSGYWDVVSILYPPCLEAAGADALHLLVPNWAVIELNLQVRFEWGPRGQQGGGAPSQRQLLPALREQAMRYCGNPRYSSEVGSASAQEALRRVEATSRLIDGVAWLSPSSPTPEDAGNWAASPGTGAAAQQGGLPPHPSASSGGAAAGGRPAAWAWHAPSDADWLAELASGGSPDLEKQSSWQLAAVALHEFRAHKDKLRLCLADEERQIIITAGKGTRDCEAIRTWALGDGEPGPQYVLHDAAAVVRMCLVGGSWAVAPPHVASCDASGALHVWSVTTGEQAYCLREAPGSARGPPGQLKCRGWLQGAWPSGPSAGASASLQPLLSGASPHPSDTSLDALGRPPPTPPASSELPAAPQALTSASAGAGARAGGDFTHVANVGRGEAAGEAAHEGGLVAAGTAGGCLCLLDVERGELAGHFECAPGSQGAASVAISALCCGQSWAAAGTRGGWLSVLDTRCGEVAWWFRRHEAAVTALGAYRGHYLVSGAKDGTVKLWDLRMGAGPRAATPQPPPAATPWQQPGREGLAVGAAAGGRTALLPSLATGATIPLCLGTFKMGADASGGAGGGGVGGLEMYGQQACICYAGPSLGVINLGAGGRSRISVTRLSAAGGAPLGATIRGLTILPLSRLFVVGSEDGWLRICR